MILSDYIYQTNQLVSTYYIQNIFIVVCMLIFIDFINKSNNKYAYQFISISLIIYFIICIISSLFYLYETKHISPYYNSTREVQIIYFINILSPLLLISKKIRQNKFLLLLVIFLMNLIYFLQSQILLISSLHKDFIESDYTKDLLIMFFKKISTSALIVIIIQTGITLYVRKLKINGKKN